MNTTMPNFSRGIRTFGMPLFPGGVMSVEAAVQTVPEFFFVSKAGSDGNSGRSPKRAKLTIQAAVNICTTEKGGYIFIGEG